MKWYGHHEPIYKWEVAKHLLGGASEGKIQDAIAGILEGQKYFIICKEREELKLSGFMHDDRTCQVCATDKHICISGFEPIVLQPNIYINRYIYGLTIILAQAIHDVIRPNFIRISYLNKEKNR